MLVCGKQNDTVICPVKKVPKLMLTHPLWRINKMQSWFMITWVMTLNH